MKDEPNAETGLYPFEGCCEHSFRVHSSKACQITGCSCKRRRQLPSIVPAGGSLVEARLDVDRDHALLVLLTDPRWKILHEVVRGPDTTMVLTKIVRPDGTELDRIAWSP